MEPRAKGSLDVSEGSVLDRSLSIVEAGVLGLKVSGVRASFCSVKGAGLEGGPGVLEVCVPPMSFKR